MAKEQKISQIDKTIQAQDRIISGARRLFLRNGFSGTSISQIAKEAGVPSGLIYHYFENKEALWQRVKDDITKYHESLSFDSLKDCPDLQSLLQKFCMHRIDTYFSNPDFMRVISWIRLEGLPLLDRQLLEPLSQALEVMQERGMLRSDVTPQLAAHVIATAISGPMFDSITITAQNAPFYVELMVKGFVASFSPQSKG